MGQSRGCIGLALEDNEASSTKSEVRSSILQRRGLRLCLFAWLTASQNAVQRITAPGSRSENWIMKSTKVPATRRWPVFGLAEPWGILHGEGLAGKRPTNGITPLRSLWASGWSRCLAGCHLIRPDPAPEAPTLWAARSCQQPWESLFLEKGVSIPLLRRGGASRSRSLCHQTET
jgi:hypothetical protein